MAVCFRHHHRADDDHHQYRRPVVATPHQLRESHRHLPSHVFRLRVRRLVGVRRRQLHLLGRPRQEESEESGARQSSTAVKIRQKRRNGICGRFLFLSFIHNDSSSLSNLSVLRFLFHAINIHKPTLAANAANTFRKTASLFHVQDSCMLQ